MSTPPLPGYTPLADVRRFVEQWMDSDIAIGGYVKTQRVPYGYRLDGKDHSLDGTIFVSAFAISTHPKWLAQIETVVRSLPDIVKLEIIDDGRRGLRPQVVAWVDEVSFYEGREAAWKQQWQQRQTKRQQQQQTKRPRVRLLPRELRGKLPAK